MNKIYTFLACIMILGLSFQSYGQTSIDIVSAQPDSMNTYCLPNATMYFSVQISVTNYTPGDLINYEINFGDGTIITGTTPISMGPAQQSFIYEAHTYQGAGTYTPQVTVTAPDGKTDVAVSSLPAIVGTCGNLSGEVYLDRDGDCTFSPGDDALANAIVEITSSAGGTMYTHTNGNGYYDISLVVGPTYDVNIASPYLNTSCPVGGHTAVTIPSSGIDFGMECTPGFDLYGIGSGRGFRPGFPMHFSAHAMNASCTSVSGTMKVVLNDPRISYSPNPLVANPPTVSGNTLSWPFSNLDFSTSLSGYSAGFNRGFYLNTSLSAAIGDTICFDVVTEPLTGDNDPSNNTRTFCFPVANSFDPNIKVAHPAGEGDDHIIAPETRLDYTVHFQNTGNDVAFNVFILDTLDENLDPSTIQVEGATHAMNLDILEDNVLRFSFPNINLPDSNSNEPESHGSVRFLIDHKKGIDLGTKIDNSAAIYFDFNKPIITNTVSRTVDIIDVVTGIQSTAENTAIIDVYPNPATDILYVELYTEDRTDLRLRTITGQTALTQSLKEGRNAINVSELANGMYLLEVQVEGHQQVERMIIHR